MGKTRQLTLVLHHNPRNPRRSVSSQLLLPQPPTTETLNPQLGRAIPGRVISQDTTKNENIELVSIFRRQIALAARVQEADALFGDSGVGDKVVDRGGALLDFGELGDGFGQAGEDELGGGRGAFGGDGAVFEVLPLFEFGVHVLDDEGVFFGGVEGGVEGSHDCVG